MGFFYSPTSATIPLALEHALEHNRITCSERIPMTKNSLTYRDSGVDYGALDLYKRTAAGRAATTYSFLARFGGYVRALPQSRGESGFVLEFPDHYIAHVE